MPHVDNPKWQKAKDSYNYCGICGHVPHKGEPANKSPLKWWDPDDGWKIGTLCAWCANDYLDVQPKPTDYAYDDFYGETSAEGDIHSFARVLMRLEENTNTDEDIISSLEE